MNALTVCVGFDDLLQITLPEMLNHFGRVLVVTSPDDERTLEYIERMSCFHRNLEVWKTEAFTENGGVFNKGLAIERGLGVLGRRGWIALVDADVLLPIDVFSGLEPDTLYGAQRRILDDTSGRYSFWGGWGNLPAAPDEYDWNGTRVTIGGHLLIFHTSDPMLRERPWFPVNWKHAGGYDSDFIAKWAPEKQKRLPFDVLHLGPTAENWHGRVTPRLDGRPVPGANEAKAAMEAMYEARKRGSYEGEKLDRK